TTDKNFGFAQIKELATSLHSMSPANIQLLTVPLKPGNFLTSAGDVVEWDPVKSRRLFRDLTNDVPITKPRKAPKVTIPPGSISLQVLNSTNRNGFAATAASDLTQLGFHVTGTGNSPKGANPNATVIRYGPGRADSARTVAAAIPGSTLRLDQSFGNGLQVQLGTTYHGARQVHVASGGQSGTLGSPRTAAQDICT
ncbi:MAG: LytR C-terminal domain-containing protein, partial [Frankiales bacterium]|nr:LytR C-terminal domain-containing protein [Frankiales bacterium]